jgi:phosphoenolpyruvate carboxylase
MTTGWQTSEQTDEGVRLRDEAEHVLFFLTDVLYRMIPPFYESFESALAATYGDRGARLRVPILVKFGTWVGGDMDGNPHVTAKSIRETLARQRSLVLNLYYQECRTRSTFAEHQPRGRVGDRAPHAALRGPFRRGASSVPARHRQMPYRLLCGWSARLQATSTTTRSVRVAGRVHRRHRARCVEPAGEQGRNAGLFAVRRLLRRAHVRLTWRRSTFARTRSWIGAWWAKRCKSPPGRRRQRARAGSTRLERRESPFESVVEARRTLAIFQTIAHCRRKYGREAIGPYIVSMAHGADDVLSVLLLAHWGHLAPKGANVPLDIAPLFETVEDVERAPQIMERLLADERYRAHLRGRGDHQIVMLGYFDSHRDGGVAAARWSLQKAQAALVVTLAGTASRSHRSTAAAAR